jgi:hypothetical protein
VITLDRDVEAARGGSARHDVHQHGRSVQLPEAEPWPEPVELAAVLDEIVGAVRRHVIFSAEAAFTVALWAAHTWVYTKFLHTPRLAITSPTNGAASQRCWRYLPISAVVR